MLATKQLSHTIPTMPPANLRVRLIEWSRTLEHRLPLGLALERVSRQQLYTRWGFTSFMAFCVTELRLDPETIRSLRLIARELITQKHFTLAQLESVGWTKCKIIAPYVRRRTLDRQQRQELIRRMLDTASDDLRRWVHHSTGTPSHTKEYRINLKLTPLQAETFLTARQHVKQHTGHAELASQLMELCHAYLEQPPNEQSPSKHRVPLSA